MGQNIVFGVIILLLAAPLAFRITYLRLYRYCKRESIPITLLVFQAGLFLFIAIAAVGFGDSGMVGVIMMIDAVGYGGAKGAVAIAVISGLMWLLLCAFELFLLGRMLLLYKAVGLGALAPAPAPAPAAQTV
jgi:hypothetical protein